MGSDPASQPPRAPGLVLGVGVAVPADVALGAHVVIHDGVRIGARVAIHDHVVLGKSPTFGALSTAARELPPPTRLHDGVALLTSAVVFAGAEIGEGAVIGDQAHVRERAVIGRGTMVGRGSAVDNDVRVGERVRIQSNCYIAARTVIEDDVFVGPGVVTANDDTMARHPPEAPLVGPTLRRACRIGAGAVICPGVEIGEEAFVAAGAVVTGDVAPRTVVMGVPARAKREVAEGELIERWR